MIGQTISHYKILEKLGEGGMGVVYKAQDTKLDRIVALKFLPSHLAADEKDKQRFIHEAKAASALDHPNICTIHEIGETPDGQLYIAMAYYEGETLQQKLGSGNLELEAVIHYTLQTAEGLQAAHKKGITHRDIKSSNIMLTPEGQVKIMDFGLAKTAAATMLTKTGSTVGTVPYMSPEQARGEKVDHRTDIWSLGVVLYEMIAGRLPFQSAYSEAIVYSILNEEPKPFRLVRSDVPMELERIVKKAMEKDCSSRYQSIDDLRVDLRRFKKEIESGVPVKTATRTVGLMRRRTYVYGGLVALAFAISLLLLMRRPSPTGIEENSIVVVPFSVRGSDRLTYLGEGMVQLLSTDLSGAGRINAIDPHTVLSAAKGSGHATGFDPDEARELAERLGAALYVQGSLLEMEGRVQITASLYDRSRGARPLVTRSVEGAAEDIFGLVKQLGAQLGSSFPTATPRAPSVRPAWTGDDVDATGSPSPDGRSLSYVDWSTGDLAIHDLMTGTNRRLTNKGNWSTSPNFAEFSRISPDGHSIAYGWFSDFEYELRVTSIDGTNVRTLLKGGWTRPRGWSADNNFVLAERYSKGKGIIAWVSVSTATLDTVLMDDSLAKGNVSVSADGRWIAFDATDRSTAAANHDIHIMAADGSHNEPVLSGSNNDVVLAWAPDGRHLLFQSDRGASRGFWALPVLNGKANGEPVLIRSDMWTDLPMGFANNDFYYSVWSSERQVYQAKIDVGNGVLLDHPVVAAHPSASASTSPVWSPDGTRLAYFVESIRSRPNTSILAVRELATGAVVEYPVAVGFPFATVQWLPDNALILFGKDSLGRFRYARFGLTSRTLTSYSVGSGSNQIGNLIVSNDGDTQYGFTWIGKKFAIIRRKISTGQSIQLHTFETGIQPILSLSPDGRHILFPVLPKGSRASMYDLPANGGTAQRIHMLPQGWDYNALHWSLDGKHILYVRSNMDGAEDSELWRLRLSDGDDRKILKRKGLASLRLHPDGERIAFNAGIRKVDVWVLERPTAGLR